MTDGSSAAPPEGAGAGAVADRRWARVREIAADITRLEAAERADGLSDGELTELARLRLAAERASARAILADELADSIAVAERMKRAAPDA